MRKDPNHDAGPKSLTLLGPVSHGFGLLSIILYAAGFLAVRSRLASMGARSHLPVADAQYLVEGTKLVLVVIELLLPYVLVLVSALVVVRLIRAAAGVVRLFFAERRWRGGWTTMRGALGGKQLMHTLFVLLLLQGALAGAHFLPPDLRARDLGDDHSVPASQLLKHQTKLGRCDHEDLPLPWTLVCRKPWSAWSGNSRFELLIVLLAASVMVVRLMSREGWLARIGWGAVIAQTLFLPLSYGQMVDYPSPPVELHGGRYDEGKSFAAYLIWTTESEYLLRDGAQVVYVPIKDAGTMRMYPVGHALTRTASERSEPTTR